MGDYTYASVFWMYSVMALFAGGSVYFLLRAVRSGAVADDESPKYRMLDDDEPASLEGRAPGGLDERLQR